MGQVESENRATSDPDARKDVLEQIKKQGIDDALIQPYSGHASRQSLEIYSRLAIADAQAAYADAMGRFPV